MKLEAFLSRVRKIWVEKASTHSYDKLGVQVVGDVVNLFMIKTSTRELFHAYACIDKKVGDQVQEVFGACAYTPVAYLLGVREESFGRVRMQVVKMKGVTVAYISRTSPDAFLSWFVNIRPPTEEVRCRDIVIYFTRSPDLPRFFEDPRQAYDEEEAYFMLKFLYLTS